MPLIKTQDRAHEFRIIVEGCLAGESVPQVASLWAEALAQGLHRKTTMDISLLTGYDSAGRKLLREMYQHGTDIAASTPGALVYLAEITAPRRRGVTVIPEQVPQPLRSARDTAPKPLIMKVAAGS